MIKALPWMVVVDNRIAMGGHGLTMVVRCMAMTTDGHDITMELPWTVVALPWMAVVDHGMDMDDHGVTMVVRGMPTVDHGMSLDDDVVSIALP